MEVSLVVRVTVDAVRNATRIMVAMKPDEIRALAEHGLMEAQLSTRTRTLWTSR